jgi:predicted DNA-binding protein
MRTTVEITDKQHRKLTALAAERGQRGFSSIVQEAIDAYLESLAGDDLEALLALEGSVTDEEAESMRRHIAEAWSVLL